MARRPYTKTEQVQTTLTEVDRQRLDAYAEARKVSRADAIRQLLLAGLEYGETPQRVVTGIDYGQPPEIQAQIEAQTSGRAVGPAWPNR